MDVAGERMKRVGAIVALVLCGSALALALVEVIARLLPLPAGDLRGLHVLRPDRPWIYGLKPGAHQPLPSGGGEYRVNADGFRDRDVAPQALPGTLRIAVVGDSLTFGWSVAEENTFPRQLEAALVRTPGSGPVEVLNLGVSGYNAYTEAALFADVGPRYRPDVVLVQFCVNDFNEPTEHFDYATRAQLPPLPDAAFPDPARRLPPPGRWVAWCERSALCARLRTLLPTPASELQRGLQAVAIHDDPSPREMAWLEARYAEMAAVAQQMGSRFGIIVFPYQGQLAGDAPAVLQAAIRSMATPHGWLVIDPLPALRAAQAGAPSSLYLDPWHPTAAGYGIVAEAVARDLRCNGVVGAPPPPTDCPRP